MRLVLCWDIDGTLLTTGRAGIFAWEDAIEEVLGTEMSLQDHPTAGLTDVEIARLLVDEAGGADPGSRGELAKRLVRRYGELLPDRLHLRTGHVMPGVAEILEHVKGRPDVLSMLLTGNIAAGARAKLSHYGLVDYFAVDGPGDGVAGGRDGGDVGPTLLGSFADGTDDRPTVARNAVELARKYAATAATTGEGGNGADSSSISTDRMFVIGDTPHDIDCGKAAGIRTVAVATGTYSTDELAEHEPWWLMARLPDPEPFLERLETAARAGSAPRPGG